MASGELVVGARSHIDRIRAADAPTDMVMSSTVRVGSDETVSKTDRWTKSLRDLPLAFPFDQSFPVVVTWE
jgi:hypothetical protein